MARKPASDHPPLPSPDYSFPAIPRAMADRFGADEFHEMLDHIAEKTAVGENPIEEFLRKLIWLPLSLCSSNWQTRRGVRQARVVACRTSPRRVIGARRATRGAGTRS